MGVALVATDGFQVARKRTKQRVCDLGIAVRKLKAEGYWDCRSERCRVEGAGSGRAVEAPFVPQRNQGEANHEKPFKSG